MFEKAKAIVWCREEFFKEKKQFLVIYQLFDMRKIFHIQLLLDHENMNVTWIPDC